MELAMALAGISAGVLALLYWRKQRADRLAGVPKRLWHRGNKDKGMELLEYPDGNRVYLVRRHQDIICSHCGEWLILRRTYHVPFQEGVDPLEHLKKHAEEVAINCIVCGQLNRSAPQLGSSEWLS